MTETPTDPLDGFVAGAAPTPEQARFVWNSHPAPSARIVAEILQRRGAKVSFRTIARWKKANWTQSTDGKGKAAIGERQTVPGTLRQAVRTELNNVPADTVTDANTVAGHGGLDTAIAGGALTKDDYARIEKLRTELMAKTEVELDQLQSKARKVFNIILLEEAARRAHVLALIPKEAGSLVSSMTEAASVGLLGEIIAPPDDAKPNGDGAKVINGTVNPPSALSDAIRRVREKADAA